MRGWKGNAMCSLCDKPEMLNDIFFGCFTTQYVWSGAIFMVLWVGKVPNLYSRLDFYEQLHKIEKINPLLL